MKTGRLFSSRVTCSGTIPYIENRENQANPFALQRMESPYPASSIIWTLTSTSSAPACPEKKIKFCCGKDIIADLNQILSKNQSGQGSAAIKQIDQVVEKSGERDCLTTIKNEDPHFAGSNRGS